VPLLAKPDACRPCTLFQRGYGFAPADGPTSAWLLLVGEALGAVEAATGRPFMGDAGGMLTRLLNLLGWTRDAIRIHNVISCQPPNDWFDERAPWYREAIGYCPYLEHTLSEGHTVVVPMGATAIKRVLRLEHTKGVTVQNFHGTVHRDPTDRFWVVPTYHPSHLQRGAHNLIGTVLWDLQRAEEARSRGKPPDPGTLIIDPPVEWFRAWVATVVAARQQDPAAYPISSDVETPDKVGGRDEGELTADDQSFQILRQNVACHPDEGVTVPDEEPYRSLLRELYASPGAIWQWNRTYDFIRLVRASYLTEADSSKVVDLMWLAKVLQSDLPMGLGFWAPFYSTWGAWKHLAAIDPPRYGAIDGLQTHRIGFGLYHDLQQTGQMHYAFRHTHEYYVKVLRPAQLVGVKVDRQRLQVFKADLVTKARASLQALQLCVPETVCPLTPKGGLTKPPLADVLHVKATAFTRKGTPRAGKAVAEVKQELYAKAHVVDRVILKEVLVCRSCGAVDVARRHRCRDAADRTQPAGGPREAPDLVLDVASVHRWFWQEPFNPDSPKQILAYLKAKGHRPGRAKKSKTIESTDRETLERLERTAGDPFYTHTLDYRAVNKVKGTYAEGTERRLDREDRIHPVPTFRPSMMRLSYVDPNITNVVADKGVAAGGRATLAAGFRRCIVASPGCRLLEVDYAGIESIQVGVCAQDPEFIRNAKRGLHAALLSHVLGRPYDPSWPEAQIIGYLKELKQDERLAKPYDSCKHYNHAKAYGITIPGMVRQYPDLFPDEATAVKYTRFFRQLAPRVDDWQHAIQERASKEHYLGGAGDHPYTYRHWFWAVYVYKRLTRSQELRLIAKHQRAGTKPPVIYINDQAFRVGPGPDANRALAFKPQSIGAGNLKEAGLRLLGDPASPSYIGDCYFGRTPLRAPIHDSLLLEIPLTQWDRVCPIVFHEMQRPILEQPIPESWGLGSYLTIGISAKAGDDWAAMTPIPVPGYDAEWVSTPMEAEDEEDWSDLQRAV